MDFLLLRGIRKMPKIPDKNTFVFSDSNKILIRDFIISNYADFGKTFTFIKIYKLYN